MKILLIAIDSKFIHTNLAVRLLKANTLFPVDILEFTIKDSQEDILAKIENENPDIIGFSVYIWNIEIVRRLTNALKNHPERIIIWGGPEVSHNPETFFYETPVDFIVRGESEFAFDQLLDALINDKNIENVPNITYMLNGKIIHNAEILISCLDHIKNPYHFHEFDGDIPNKIQYVESSRGCPYHCTYCLASLDNHVREFDLERVKSDLIYLQRKGGKTFKFLDRTFNLKNSRVLDLLDFIIRNHRPNTSFQFEVSGDLLTDELIDKIHDTAPANLIRFEIGIQSTHAASNTAVKRTQNLEKLFRNIKKLQERKIVDLHLDLIAGLPKETLSLFEKTFNTAFLCFAKELQLGFLKLLRGTPLRNEADSMSYIYSARPPYEILENKWLSRLDMDTIRLVEKTLNIYWNRGFMDNAITFITTNIASPFRFFHELGRFYIDHGYSFIRYQLPDVFARLNFFLEQQYPEIHVRVLSLLKRDYLEYHHLKPKLWWDHKNIHKNELLREFYETNQEIPLDLLYKHAVVTQCEDKYMIVVYLPNQRLTLYKPL
ncbi:MAG: DUF4080 domain-containing protein [Bacilli bacterium]|nr:DUF4080 domain-containing protein [Bacilli bacterium]